MADEFKEMDVAEYKSVQVLNERAHKLIDWIKENCYFEIDETVSKAEYLALQEKLEVLNSKMQKQEKELVFLTGFYNETIKTIKKEDSINSGIRVIKVKDGITKLEKVKEETKDKWVLFEDRLKKVKSTISKLDGLVLSAIYYEKFHQGTKFWPALDPFFDLGKMKQLELENMIRIDIDDMRITPNYDEYSVRQAVDLLHELLRYISSNIDEKMKQEFKEEQKFYLDFNSEDFWQKILSL